jgi:hypothetical protein
MSSLDFSTVQQREQHVDSSEMMTSSTLSMKSRVSFSTVEFKSHEMILGNSPATGRGPPLEISWEAMGRSSLKLDEYESVRPPRRTKQELLLPARKRQSL